MILFAHSLPLLVLPKYACCARDEIYDLADILGYYTSFVKSDKGIESAIVWCVIPNQELPLVPPQDILRGPQLGNVLPFELRSNHPPPPHLPKGWAVVVGFWLQLGCIIPYSGCLIGPGY